MTKSTIPDTPFDAIVRSRIHAADFAQPAHDAEFYKAKAIGQIESSIKAIGSASSNHEFNVAVAQANAFIDAAINFEFIDLTEKAKWLDDVAKAMRAQLIEEYV